MHENRAVGSGQAFLKPNITIKICIMRPEGPKGNRPGRQAGNEIREILSAESAALQMHAKMGFIILEILICAAPSVLIIVFLIYPELTLGPISFRPFGPSCVSPNKF
jgi:hypothetical protein